MNKIYYVQCCKINKRHASLNVTIYAKHNNTQCHFIQCFWYTFKNFDIKKDSAVDTTLIMQSNILLFTVLLKLYHYSVFHRLDMLKPLWSEFIYTSTLYWPPNSNFFTCQPRKIFARFLLYSFFFYYIFYVQYLLNCSINFLNLSIPNRHYIDITTNS